MRVLKFILLLPILCVAAGTVNGQQWTPLGPKEISMPSSGSPVSDVSIAASPGGTLYIAYSDGSNAGKAAVKKYNTVSSEWDILGSGGFSAGAVRDISIAVDQNNIPYVVYSDAGDGNKARAKRFNVQSNVWEDAGTGLSAGSASHTSVVISGDNYIYAAYRDEANGNKAAVKRYNAASNAWEDAGSGLSTGEVNYTAAAASPDNDIYIVYQDAGKNGRASVQRLHNGGWQLVGQSGFSMGAAAYTTIVAAAADKVYVVYRDAANENKATVQQFNGSTWNIVGTLGFSRGAVEYTAIALDEAKVPYVIYQDNSLNGKANSKRFNIEKEIWEDVGGQGFSHGEAAYTAITSISGGGICLAYRDAGLNQQIIVQKLDKGLEAWESFGSGIASGSGAFYSAIATATDGSPYVVYSDAGNAGKISVRRYDPLLSSWQPIGKNGFSKGAANYTSIAVGPLNIPYVVFQDGRNYNKATAMRYNQAVKTWETLGMEGFSDGLAAYTVIACGPDGKVWVAYQDGANGKKATVKCYNTVSSTWETMGASGFSTGEAAYISLIVGADNNPYIAYQDGVQGKITVKSFKTSTSSWETVGTEGFSSGTALYTAVTLDNNNIPHVIYQDAGFSGRAVVKRWDTASSSWKTVGNAGFSGGKAAYTRIAFSIDNKLYAAYQDESRQNKIGVRYYDPAAALWEPAGEGFSSGAASHVGLAGGSGKLYLLYQDGGAGNTATVTQLSRPGDNWINIGTNAVSAGTAASYTSIASNSAGTPYLIYSGAASGGKAVVKRHNKNSGWEILGSETISAAAASYTSIAVDKNGIVYSSFSDASVGNKIIVRKYAGNTWQTVGLQGFSSGAAVFSSIVLDQNNNPYVIYQDKNLSKILVQEYAGNAWNVLGAGFPASGEAYPTLTSDNNNILYAAFRDESQNGRITVKRYNRTASVWETVGQAGFSSGSIAYAGIAVTTAGEPYVVYQDASKGDKAVVKRWSETAQLWQTVGIEGISTGPAYYTDIAIDPSNRPYIIYKDNWNSGKATVKRFDTASSSWQTVSDEGFSVSSVNYTSLAVGSGGSVYAAFQGSASRGGEAEVYLLNENFIAWKPAGGSSASPGSPIAYAGAAIDKNLVPYIIYRDSRNSNNVSVKRYNKSADLWELVGNERLSEGPISFSTITIDQNNIPWVAYQDSSRQNKITVRRYNPVSSRWEIAGNAGFSSGSAAYIAITTGANNIPYVVYQDSTAGKGVSVQRFNTGKGAWELIGKAGFSNGEIVSPAIAVDKNGIPFIAYSDPGAGGKATVKYYDISRGGWETAGTEGFSAGKVQMPGLMYDNNGVLHIIYSDGSRGNRLTVQRFVSGIWQTAGGAGFSWGAAGFPSLLFDQNNVPYAAYQDAANNNKLSVQRYNSSRSLWEAVGQPGFSINSSTYNILLPGPDNLPYVVYRDAGIGGQLAMQVLSNNSLKWEPLEKPGLSAGYTAAYSAVAVGSDKIPYIIYQDAGNSGKAVVKKYDSKAASWKVTGAPGLSAGTASFNAITVKGNEVYAAFQDGGNGNKITLKTYNSTTSAWQTLGTEGFSKGQVNYISIAADGGGTVYAAYQDVGNGSRLTVKKINVSAGVWETAGTEGFSDGQASYISIAMAPDNKLWAAYQDAGLQGKAVVKRFNGTTWETIGSAGFSMGTASHIRLAIGSDGSVYTAYSDGANSGRITVQKYNNASQAWDIVGTVGFSASGTGDISLTLNENNVPYVAYRDGLYLRTAWYNAAKENWKISPSVSIGMGSYSGIAFASDGSGYLVFQDAGLANEVTVKKLNKNVLEWEYLGLGRVSYSENSDYAAAAIDKNESIYYIASDKSLSDKATVKTYNKTIDGWENLGPAGFSPGAAEYPDIAADKDNNLYAAYRDGRNFNKLSVYRFNKTNSVWETIGLGISDGAVSDISIITGSDNKIWASYKDQSAENKAVVKFSDGTGTWTAAGTSASSAGVNYLRFALSSNNIPYVVYQDGSQAGKIIVKRFNSVSQVWEQLGGSVSPGRAEYPAVAVDKNNTVYAAYQDTLQKNRITVKRFNSGNTTWEPVGKEGFSPASVSYISIAVDKNNVLYAMYRDNSKSARLTVMRYNSQSSEWEAVGNEGISRGGASYISALITEDSKVYAVYRDESAGGQVDARMLNTSGTRWSSSGSAGISMGYAALYTSITLDSKNIPYLAYQDGGENAAATVKRYNEAQNEWETLGRPRISVGSAAYTTVTADNNDNVFTAYADGGNGNRLMVKRYNRQGNFWEEYGSIVIPESNTRAVSRGAVSYITLDAAPNNTLYAAYQDEWSRGRATVKRYNPQLDSWVNVGNEGFSAGAAPYTTLAISPENIPYAAYQDEVNGKKVTVKVFNAGKWETLGSEGFSAGEASYVSIAAASDSFVYVVYRDASQGNKATAMYYNSENSVWEPLGQPGFTVAAVSYTKAFTDRYDLPYVIYSDENQSGQITISRYNPVKNIWEIVGEPGLSAGPSIYPSAAVGSDNQLYTAYASGQAFAKVWDCKTAFSLQPTNTEVCKDADGSFNVLAEGTDISYMWQVDKGSGFKYVKENELYSGVHAAALKITAAPEVMNGYQVRCIAIGDCVGASNAASIVIKDLIPRLASQTLKAVESISFKEQLDIMGGIAPYSFKLIDGGLPAGLILTAEGEIKGAPLKGTAGTYTFSVQITESSECKNNSDASFTLTVEDLSADQIDIHPVVTPNGDGKNDFLVIPGIERFPENHLVIVTRNGTPVFDMRRYDNMTTPFRGKTTYGMDLLPAGTYFYMLEYKAGGKMHRKSGYLVLKY